MDTAAKQQIIRQIAQENGGDPEGAKILWSRHAITELVNEDWEREAVEQGLQTCEVVEDYPQIHRRLPDCLVLSWLSSQEPFHAVVALDESQDRLLIVTVYSPSNWEWEDDQRTRRH